MVEQFTCAFCGGRYTEEESRHTCANCSLLGGGGCRKLRCPHCGYETPQPARLPRLLKRLAQKLRQPRKEEEGV